MNSTDLSEGMFRNMFGGEYALDAHKSGTNPDAFKHIIGSSATDTRKESIVQLLRTARDTEQYELIEAVHDLLRTEYACLPGIDPTTKEGALAMKQIMDSRSPATKEEDVRPVTLQLIKDATGFRGGVLWLKFVQSQAFIKDGTEISSPLQFVTAMAGQFNLGTATGEEQILHQLCAQKLAKVLEQQKFEKGVTQAQRAETW